MTMSGWYIKLLERKKNLFNINRVGADLNIYFFENKLNQFDFQSSSNTSPKELAALYGYQPKGPDMVLKYAEQKNFIAAENAFVSLTVEEINTVENYLSDTFSRMDKSYYKEHQYAVLKYFEQLINGFSLNQNLQISHAEIVEHKMRSKR